MVPGVGFEPTHLSASVFETDVSAVPPPGRNKELYPIVFRIQQGFSLTWGLREPYNCQVRFQKPRTGRMRGSAQEGVQARTVRVGVGNRHPSKAALLKTNAPARWVPNEYLVRVRSQSLRAVRRRFALIGGKPRGA